MTIKDLIEGKDFDFIELRIFAPELHKSVFIGSAKSKSGELISLDGDTYRNDAEVIEWEEWSGKKAKNAVTVVCKSL